MFTGIAGIAGFTGTATGGGAPTFVPTDLGAKLIAWYDPSDLTTLDKAGPNPVTTDGDAVLNMRDKSGNAQNFTQGSAGLRALWKIDGSGNKYLLFDGSDDCLSLGTLTLALPWDRISAVQSVSWTNGDYFWGTSVAGRPGALLQFGTTPAILCHDGNGAGGASTSALTVGTNGVVTERHIAAATQIAVNNGAYTTSNAGSTGLSGTTILGATSTIGGSAGNIRFYGAVIGDGTLTSGEIAQVRTYLGNKCGLTL